MAPWSLVEPLLVPPVLPALLQPIAGALRATRALRVFPPSRGRVDKHLYGHNLRGELNDAKSSAFSFGITEAQARAAGLAPDIPFGTAELSDGPQPQAA